MASLQYDTHFSCVKLALILLIPIITGDNHLVCKVLQFNYSYKFIDLLFGHHIYTML